jgi:glycosyltransferase involved in cell wall biosynthesis
MFKKNYRESKRIAIILPAYNEEKTVDKVIRDFHLELPDAAIWVVNNNSEDSTEKVALATFGSLLCHGGVLNEDKKGKGNAVRRAIIEIEADIYIFCDADLTYPAGIVKDLIAPIIENKADMVVGDRRRNGHYRQVNNRFMHDFGNALVCKLINLLFHSNLSDILSGYRVFNRRFIKNYPILVQGFELETDMTLHALDKRFRIKEIPIEYKNRPDGSESKLHTFKDGMKVLFIILQISRYYKPMAFFAIIALIFLLAGSLAGAPVIIEWMKNGYISHIPLAILATGLEIMAGIMISIGIILDSNVQQAKRDFERNILSGQY